MPLYHPFPGARAQESTGVFLSIVLRPVAIIATAILTILIFGAAILREAIDRSRK